jgi:hypothetical protein
MRPNQTKPNRDPHLYKALEALNWSESECQRWRANLGAYPTEAYTALILRVPPTLKILRFEVPCIEKCRRVPMFESPEMMLEKTSGRSLLAVLLESGSSPWHSVLPHLSTVDVSAPDTLGPDEIETIMKLQSVQSFRAPKDLSPIHQIGGDLRFEKLLIQELELLRCDMKTDGLVIVLSACTSLPQFKH